MAIVTLTCMDFMDGGAIGGGALTVRLLAVPRFLVRDDHPAGPQHPPVPTLTAEFDLAQTLERRVTSGDDGRATARFGDAGATFQRAAAVTLSGDRPHDVVGIVEVDVEVDGLRRTWRFAEDVPGAAVGAVQPDGSADLVLAFDFALTILGHTTSTSTRILVDLRVTPAPADAYVIAVTAEGEASPLAMVPFARGAPDPVTVVVVNGLRPGTRHAYEVQLRTAGTRPGVLRRVLARGSVRTPAVAPGPLTLGFASCHRPTTVDSLERWGALARRTDVDLLLLMGDQIYEDAVSAERGSTWEERYLSRYRRFLGPHVVRDVLRRTPTLMALDDHEVKDDFGIVPVTSDVDEAENPRRIAALNAYRLFQDSLNPSGRPADQFDYGFRVGAVAGYVLDCRTHRVLPPANVIESRSTTWPDAPASPMLGEVQRARLQRWAEDTATRSADVIVLVAPVPIAFLPVGELLRLIEDIEATAAEDGLGFGALIGGLIGGLAAGLASGGLGFGAGAYVGAVFGGMAGGVGADLKVADTLDTKGFADLTSRDLADQWTWPPNQQDLAFVLNVLFALANDLGADGSRGPRPRAVFVLGGDVHAGSMHEIVSADPRHARQRAVHQLISSPISKTPATDRLYEHVVRHIRPGVDIGHLDLLRVAAGGSLESVAEEAFGEGPARFVLDDEGAKSYATEIIDFVATRNIGTLRIEALPGTGRRYRFVAGIEGREHAIVQAFDLGLDAAVIVPDPVVGDILAVEGIPTFLRVHEIGSGFGPPTARIEEEVVVELDSLPGRYFGLSLRPSVAGPISTGVGEAVAEEMWTTLRGAFERRGRLHVEYMRTGITTGRIIRVHEIG